MTHKVYAFLGQQPFGLIDAFKTRPEAKECALRVERDGIKGECGNFVPAKTKIVVS
jgi:hypothetical protein